MTTTSHLQEAITEERERHRRRVEKLRRAAEAEQRRVDDRVLVLLREQHADLHEQLAAEAARALEAERDQRSRRARQAGQPSSAVPGDPAADGGGHPLEEEA